MYNKFKIRLEYTNQKTLFIIKDFLGSHLILVFRRFRSKTCTCVLLKTETVTQRYTHKVLTTQRRMILLLFLVVCFHGVKSKQTLTRTFTPNKLKLYSGDLPRAIGQSLHSEKFSCFGNFDHNGSVGRIEPDQRKGTRVKRQRRRKNKKKVN